MGEANEFRGLLPLASAWREKAAQQANATGPETRSSPEWRHLAHKGSLAAPGGRGVVGWTIKVQSHPLQVPPTSARALSSSAAPLPASTSAWCVTGRRTVPTAPTRVDSARGQLAAEHGVPTPATSPRVVL